MQYLDSVSDWSRSKISDYIIAASLRKGKGPSPSVEAIQARPVVLILAS